MHRIPNYARRIEYIQSSGTQWIDTGVAPDDNKLSFDVRCVNLAASTTLRGAFGCRASSSAYKPGSYVVFLRSTSRAEARVDVANSGAAIYTTATVGEETRFAWDAATRTLTKTVRGTPEAFTADEKGPCAYNFLLGSISTAGVPAAVGASMRIVSAQFWLSGVLVRSFVPCRVVQTGYLWDECEGKFFGNSGTGNFVLGTDIAGGGYQRLRFAASVRWEGRANDALRAVDSCGRAAA